MKIDCFRQSVTDSLQISNFAVDRITCNRAAVDIAVVEEHAGRRGVEGLVLRDREAVADRVRRDIGHGDAETLVVESAARVGGAHRDVVRGRALEVE